MTRAVLLLTIVSYSFVVSQSLMYILALKNTQMELGARSYTEVRHLIDNNMNRLFKTVMYITLLSSLALVLVNVKQPTGIMFITASIAFVALVIDAVLSLKGNVPLNAIIRTWSPADVPADWKEVRQQWFNVFQYRQAANMIGYMSLIVGAIFGRS